MNPVKSGSRASTPTFDPTSETYKDELHKAGFISNAQLAAAKSGDQSAIREADDEVVNLAIFLHERPLTKKQSEEINPGFLKQQKIRDQKLETNYMEKGYKFARNNGEGHNCLIISVLQHFTGQYENEHKTKAGEYRARLNTELKKNLNDTQKKAFRENDMLVPDHLNWLLAEMSKDPEFKSKKLTVECWMASAEGTPISFSFGNGKDKVIVFQRANHFEAVTPPDRNTAVTVATTPGPTIAPRLTLSLATATSPGAATAPAPVPIAISAKASPTTGTTTANVMKSQEKDIFLFEPTDLDFFDKDICPINLDKPDSFAADFTTER